MSVIRQRPSQTLLEAILAIGVILVAVFSSTTLIVSTVTAGQSSEDKILAGNLAREGIEVVRGIRDSNWIKRAENITAVDWNSGLTDGNYIAKFSGSSGWFLPATGSSAVNTFLSGGIPLYFTQDCTGTCTPTKFSRTINIASGNDVVFGSDIPFLSVTATVNWDNHGAKSLVMTERLYDWR